LKIEKSLFTAQGKRISLLNRLAILQAILMMWKGARTKPWRALLEAMSKKYNVSTVEAEVKAEKRERSGW